MPREEPVDLHNLELETDENVDFDPEFVWRLAGRNAVLLAYAVAVCAPIVAAALRRGIDGRARLPARSRMHGHARLGTLQRTAASDAPLRIAASEPIRAGTTRSVGIGSRHRVLR